MRRIIPIFLFLAVLIFIIFSSPICLAEGGDLDEYISYYVQVPAQLKPGETGSVSASGMWGTNEILKVTTDDTVTLSYEDQTLVLSVHFDGINSLGKGGTQMLIESLISIEDKEVMFGEWVGHITYNVELYEKQADCENDVHVDANGDGNCDSCGKTFITIDGIGDLAVNNPNIEFTYNPDTGDIGGVVPPEADKPEVPEEIPSNQLPELISFGLGKFDSNTIYTPGTYEEVQYEKIYNRIKTPVPYQKIVWSKWNITKDSNNNIIRVTPNEITLDDITNKYSTYILYNFDTDKYMEMNGVAGDSVELTAIYNNDDDSIENAIYLAAYLNKVRENTNNHIAQWNGSKYIAVDYDSEIEAINTFTETYSITEVTRVQVAGPTADTSYVYIPMSNMKAEKGMTWEEWLTSDYNKTGETSPTIKTSNLEDVAYSDVIVGDEEYGFFVAPKYELKGKWTLSSTIDMSKLVDIESLEENIMFTSDGSVYSSIRFSQSSTSLRKVSLYYDDLHIGQMAYSKNNSTNVSFMPIDSKYLSFDFGDVAQPVSQLFYEWFITNAVQN